VYEEIGKGDDGLPRWLDNNKRIFRKQTIDAVPSIPAVLGAYGDPMTEAALERLKADPYVIAHAHVENAAVVTDEAPNKATASYNKKIPTVCQTLKIQHIRFPRFIWDAR
jgi:hypothetical protein